MPDDHPSTRAGTVASVERALLSDLLSDFDALEVLDRAVHAAVDATAAERAAILVPHPDGMQVLAATSELARDLELFQVMTGEGPAHDCLDGRVRVVAPDLMTMHERWPDFAPMAQELGVRSITSLYMQLRGVPVGAFNLFGRDAIGPDGLQDAQALADLAVLAVAQSVEPGDDSARVRRRLRLTLDRRVVVEQAKGVLAEWLDLTPAEAGAILLDRARSSGELLGRLAGRVVRLEAEPGEFARR